MTWDVRRLANAALLAVGMAVFAASAGAAPPAQTSGYVVLSLPGALSAPFGTRPAPEKTLNVYATYENGAWNDAWGECLQFNKAIHTGTVTTGEIADNRVRLKVTMQIDGDHWVKGGQAVYEIDVKRMGSQLEGTFTGTNEGADGTCKVQGTASGQVLPLEPLRPGFTPVQPGEHPRLLLRKSDLPALRKKAETPFGQAMIEEMQKTDDPVAMGLLYQLTGDKTYAQRAIAPTQKVMDNRNGGAFALGRFWGYRTIVIANAYDLCYDAWPAEFKERVENYFDWILYKCLYRQHRVGTVNWDPGSNYTMVIHAGNGAAALALWGEKGGAPLEPLPPRTEAPHIAPAQNYQPGAGVPVFKLEANKMPLEWLYAGPFEQHVNQHDHPYYDYADVDCLAAVGGEEQVRPTPGMKVQFKHQTIEWKPISQQTDPAMFKSDFGPQVLLNSSRLSGYRENTHLYYYTVVQNDKPGYYQVDAPFYEGRSVLGGVRMPSGEIVYLDKGQYPLLVPVAMADGEYTASIYFRESSEEKAKAFYGNPARRRSYEAAKAQYETDLAAWKAAGEKNLRWMRFADVLRHWNYLNVQHGMGDGGFQAEGEGYTLECAHVEHDYANIYLNVCGRSLSGRPDIGYFAPRYVETTVWKHDDRGNLSAVNQTYGRSGGLTIQQSYLTRAIAICPPEWKPALLWFWLREAGVTAAEMRTAEGARKVFWGGSYEDTDRGNLARVFAFINYPLDLEPQSPDRVMPHTWYAEGKGLVVFRNNWDDDNSIVAQIYAKQGSRAGWNQPEAASFQVFGLGREWAWKNNDGLGKTGSRWFDNVVLLPEDPVDAWAGGRVTYFSGDAKTGTGVVTIDMANNYRCTKLVKNAAGQEVEERYDGGIHGLRSFAADYSGKAGVPGLIAVVDDITGGHKKVWTYQLPRTEGAQVDIDGNSFTITIGDASLKATFIGPKKVKISKVQGPVSANKLSHIDDVTANAIMASGEDGQGGDFFVVMTLQKGTPPPVSVDGEGLKAKVTVGNQTISYDGTKILFGETAGSPKRKQ